jgi:hypothetical protein
MQEQTLTRSHEPGASRNGLLWVAVIYPFFIAILSITCQSKMSSVIESIPITESASSHTGGERTPAGSKAAPLVDDDGNSNSPTKGVADVAESGTVLEATKSPPRPVDSKHVLSSADAPLQSPPVNEAENRTSIQKSQITQASILHILVMLMTHILGIVATRHVQETQSSGEKMIALVAMAVATILALLSGGKLELGRALFMQGYRDNSGTRPPMDRYHPLVAFIVLSFFSLLIPWIRLLLAWWWTGF